MLTGDDAPFPVTLVGLGLMFDWLKMGAKSLLEINKGMILIRVIYAFWSFGKRPHDQCEWGDLTSVWAGMSLIFPYLTLQALGLGLTYEDISIIYGISPVIALAAGPIAGLPMKYLDRIVHGLMQAYCL